MVVRFAGDSGDGMQLTGGQFTLSTALAGEDFATFPDFPAEIRAPQGTTFGVSAFQINFGAGGIETAGDEPDVLVAMNPCGTQSQRRRPARRRTGHHRQRRVQPARNLAKAGYAVEPARRRQPRASWQVMAFDISRQTLEAVRPFGLGNKEALRCKNMWTLGLALWMFDRSRAPLIAVAPRQVQQEPGARAGQRRRAQCRPCLRRDRRARRAAQAVRGRRDRGRAGLLPHRHRRRVAGSGSSPGRSSRTCRCSSARTPSRRRRRSSMRWRGSRSSASPPSRPRTRSPRSARRSARAMPGSSASPRRAGRASRSRARRWASRSSPSCRSSSSTRSAAGRRPGCRPRPSRATCIRRSTAATATRRSSCWRRARPATASRSRSRRAGLRSSS